MSDLYSALKRAGLATKLSDTVFAAGGQIARNALQVYLGDSAQALQFDEPGLAQVQAAAHLAPFGWGEQTMQDTAVRDTWEVNGSALQLAWQAGAEQNLAEQVSRALCLPETLNFSLSLHKLLLYKPGQFFKPHTDSEKAPGMLATLVLVLPSAHRGGLLQVNHGKLQQTFASELMQPGQLNWFAFYADCPHQVLPVESGNRVVLTFNLCIKTQDWDHWWLLDSYSHERQNIIVDSDKLFSENTPVIFPLSHKYTRDGLQWHLLKGADIQLARFVKSLVKCSGWKIWLAQMKQVTNYHLIASGDSDRWGSACIDEYFDSFGRPDDTILSHFRDEFNQALPDWCTVKQYGYGNQFLIRRERWELDDQAIYAGWSGNEGQHVVGWYRGAALICAPAHRLPGLLAHHEIMQSLNNFAVSEPGGDWESRLSEIVDRGSDEEPLFPPGFWLKLALAVTNKDLAAKILAHLDLYRVPSEALPDLMEVYRRWGEVFFTNVFVERHCTYLDTMPSASIHTLFSQLIDVGISNQILLKILRNITTLCLYVAQSELCEGQDYWGIYSNNFEVVDWRTAWYAWAEAVSGCCRAAFSLNAPGEIDEIFSYCIEHSGNWTLEFAETWLERFNDITAPESVWFEFERRLLLSLMSLSKKNDGDDISIPIFIRCPANNTENGCHECSALEQFSRSNLPETTLTTTPMKAAHMVEQIAFYRLPIASRLQEDGRNSQFQMTKTAQLQLDLADRRQRMQRCIAEFQRRSISAGQA